MANYPGNPGEMLALETLDEIVLGARGRGRPPGVSIEFARSLEEDDLEALADAEPLEKPAGSAASAVGMRHAHHQLAQLLVIGKPVVEVALITGYTPEYISGLKNNPAFEELLAYYQQQREIVFADELQRLRGLGIASMEELQRRLLEEPEKWAKKELMEMAELAFGKAAARPSGASVQSASGGVNIEVKFVTGKEPAMIDVTPKGCQ